MSKRIYFLDNLRTFLIFLVVLLHSGLVYETVLQNSWIVSDPMKNDNIGLIRMYLDLFVMFSIFYISGYFIPKSVKSKSIQEFILSKFKRIILPWLMAVLTLIPAYKFIFLYSRGMPQEAWYTYFHIYSREGSDLSFYANNPVQNWLWFLPVLFTFQIIYLILKKSKAFNFTLSVKNAVIILFITGVVYSLLISASGKTGWTHSAIYHFQNERLLIYFMSFLLGALSYKHKVFSPKSKKNTRLYIMSNIVLSIALTVFTIFALNIFFNLIDPARNYNITSEWGDKLVYYASAIILMLSFLYILLYSFQWYFNKNSTLLNELNNNSYYVYIIHLIVLGLIAISLKETGISVWAKFIILTLSSFIVSNVLVSLYLRIFKGESSNVKAVLVSLTAIIVYTAVDIKQSEEISVMSIKQEQNNTAADVSLIESVLKDDVNTLKLHIANGENINSKDNTSGSTPLITAIAFGKTQTALELINSGADLNLQNNDGSTAVHTAAFFCRLEILDALLKKGADKTIRNKAGQTAKETALLPYEVLEPYYNKFREDYKKYGVELDLERIKNSRKDVAVMLE